MDKEKDNEKVMIEKLEFYKENKIMIHIELKDKRFLNARIIERSKNNKNVYIINERILGLMHLFVSDVYRITEYMGEK